MTVISWRFAARVLIASIALAMFPAASVAAHQAQPQRGAAKAAPAPTPGAINEEELNRTREELFKLLEMSPKLTRLIAADPVLLSQQDYIAQKNPALGQFLEAHPEVARNPEFYLFANTRNGGPQLQVESWPEQQRQRPGWRFVEDYVVPFAAFLVILFALLWLIRVLLENRRWNRIFTVQTDVYSKLMEKFSSSQEMAAYMGTDAGRRLLESASLPLNLDRPARGGTLGRLLMPLQVGVVLVPVGLGLLYLRNRIPDGESALLVVGTLALTLGFGFILAAGVSLSAAKQLGELPGGRGQSVEASGERP
jgi:hypothetical protein